VRAHRLVHGQRQIGEDLADEEIRARVARDEVGVLADPAEPALRASAFSSTGPESTNTR
jgi:hypothetical protein